MLLPALLVVMCASAHAQYIIGADVSYLKQAQDFGTVFKEDGQPKPALDILERETGIEPATFSLGS